MAAAHLSILPLLPRDPCWNGGEREGGGKGGREGENGGEGGKGEEERKGRPYIHVPSIPPTPTTFTFYLSLTLLSSSPFTNYVTSFSFSKYTTQSLF